MKRIILAALTVVAIGAANHVHAQTYRYTDKYGRVDYNRGGYKVDENGVLRHMDKYGRIDYNRGGYKIGEGPVDKYGREKHYSSIDDIINDVGAYSHKAEDSVKRHLK